MFKAKPSPWGTGNQNHSETSILLGLLESKCGRYQVLVRVWRHWSLRALLVGIEHCSVSAENSLAAAQKATYRISL